MFTWYVQLHHAIHGARLLARGRIDLLEDVEALADRLQHADSGAFFGGGQRPLVFPPDQNRALLQPPRVIGSPNRISAWRTSSASMSARTRRDRRRSGEATYSPEGGERDSMTRGNAFADLLGRSEEHTS